MKTFRIEWNERDHACDSLSSSCITKFALVFLEAEKSRQEHKRQEGLLRSLHVNHFADKRVYAVNRIDGETRAKRCLRVRNQ